MTVLDQAGPQLVTELRAAAVRAAVEAHQAATRGQLRRARAVAGPGPRYYAAMSSAADVLNGLGLATLTLHLALEHAYADLLRQANRDGNRPAAADARRNLRAHRTAIRATLENL